MPTTTATTALTWATSAEGWTDERTQDFRRQEGRPRGRRCAGQGRPAPPDVPPPQGVQVLLGQDRRHQLQGHQAAAPVRAGAREDSAAPYLGHLRTAPAEAAGSADARAPAGAHPVHGRVAGLATETQSWK